MHWGWGLWVTILQWESKRPGSFRGCILLQYQCCCQWAWFERFSQQPFRGRVHLFPPWQTVDGGKFFQREITLFMYNLKHQGKVTLSGTGPVQHTKIMSCWPSLSPGKFQCGWQECSGWSTRELETIWGWMMCVAPVQHELPGRLALEWLSSVKSQPALRLWVS